MFENLRRSLGKAGMCCSRPARVNHMCKKRWVGGRRKILQGRSLGYSRRASGRPVVAHQLQLAICLTADWPLPKPPFSNFLGFFFFWVFKDGPGILGMGVHHSHFLNLAPTLGRVKFSILHEAWRFHFFPILFAKIRIRQDLHIHH
jgi:hypothetical protein